jgi:hypothetical protein
VDDVTFLSRFQDVGKLGSGSVSDFPAYRDLAQSPLHVHLYVFSPDGILAANE